MKCWKCKKDVSFWKLHTVDIRPYLSFKTYYNDPFKVDLCEDCLGWNGHKHFKRLDLSPIVEKSS